MIAAPYLKTLVNTHVLWAVVPCPPPNPGAANRRRYANDLRITMAYLREALRLRTVKSPAAVALVLSKVDALFPDAEQARASLPDEALRTALGPLVHLIDTSARVSDAVIIPVSAFGFGNAVLRDDQAPEEGQEDNGEDSGEDNGRAGATSEFKDEAFGGEPVWLLREGVTQQPFNLDALFLWTLIVGLRRQGGQSVLDEAESGLGKTCRALRADFEAAEPWLVRLKGSFA